METLYWLRRMNDFMDQIKVGKFIAELRKQQGMTQKSMADSLGISDKTISKWENGKGLPEYTLLLPLCELLGITVNELLSGERLFNDDYNNKAEENIIHLFRETEKVEKSSRRSNLVSIIGSVVLSVFLLKALMVILHFNEIFIYLIDLPTLILVVGVVMLELISTKSVRAFLNAFKIIFQKSTADEKEIRISLQAVKLVFFSVMLGGGLCAIISFVAVLRYVTDMALIGPNLSVAIISIFDSILLLLLLLPLKNRLETMLVQYDAER